MEYKDTPYFHVGRASELSGRDRILYRALEIFPGAFSWLTILLTILVSIYIPFWAAIFIIVFDTFWLLKTIYLSIHLYHNYKRVKYHLTLDWTERMSHVKYEEIYHVVILPFYKETRDVIESTITSLQNSNYDKKKIIVVLASEENAGEIAQIEAKYAYEKWKDVFGYFLVTTHPKNLPGEIAGKGSNISYAAEEMRKQILDVHKISYSNVLVSAFDIDTTTYPDYFNCLTWHFLTSPNPYRTSFQPIPLYNNNLWQAPAFSRTAAMSGTFWQMIQQERPEKLVTFSSHAISFKTLYEIGYWQKNMVSEDSRIFWNAFMAYNGDYTVTPIAYPVSMDANLAATFWQTIKNIYKQHRRWMWGAESVPYILLGFIKNKKIPLGKRIKTALVQIDGYWSLATNPIFILLLGWLPLMLGGHSFNALVLSYNLPIVTRNIMTLSMIGLVVSALVSFQFLPPHPTKKRLGIVDWFVLFIQWFLIPINIIIFGAIPGLEAQTRLMLGKYMGFWVTPKHRSYASTTKQN